MSETLNQTEKSDELVASPWDVAPADLPDAQPDPSFDFSEYTSDEAIEKREKELRNANTVRHQQYGEARDQEAFERGLSGDSKPPIDPEVKDARKQIDEAYGLDLVSPNVEVAKPATGVPFGEAAPSKPRQPTGDFVVLGEDGKPKRKKITEKLQGFFKRKK